MSQCDRVVHRNYSCCVLSHIETLRCNASVEHILCELCLLWRARVTTLYSRSNVVKGFLFHNSECLHCLKNEVHRHDYSPMTSYNVVLATSPQYCSILHHIGVSVALFESAVCETCDIRTANSFTFVLCRINSTISVLVYLLHIA